MGVRETDEAWSRESVKQSGTRYLGRRMGGVAGEEE